MLSEFETSINFGYYLLCDESMKVITGIYLPNVSLAALLLTLAISNTRIRLTVQIIFQIGLFVSRKKGTLNHLAQNLFFELIVVASFFVVLVRRCCNYSNIPP